MGQANSLSAPEMMEPGTELDMQQILLHWKLWHIHEKVEIYTPKSHLF